MSEFKQSPHAKRAGQLKNRNRSGDLSKVRRCGAKTRRAGTSCQAPAMRNGRCRLHGGLSTGARTDAGLKRIAAANYRHGGYTKAAKEARRRFRQTRREVRAMLAWATSEMAKRYKIPDPI